MKVNEIVKLIKEKFGEEAITAFDENNTLDLVTVSKEWIKPICSWLLAHNKLHFDTLVCLSGLDNGVDSATMEVVYNLYSIPFEHSLMLKVELLRENPSVDSVSDIWRTANWHERESFDLLGIEFKGHPDLRRILLPADWEGHPLRKDYQDMEIYHGMKVRY